MKKLKQTQTSPPSRRNYSIPLIDTLEKRRGSRTFCTFFMLFLCFGRLQRITMYINHETISVGSEYKNKIKLIVFKHKSQLQQKHLFNKLYMINSCTIGYEQKNSTPGSHFTSHHRGSFKTYNITIYFYIQFQALKTPKYSKTCDNPRQKTLSNKIKILHIIVKI